LRNPSGFSAIKATRKKMAKSRHHRHSQDFKGLNARNALDDTNTEEPAERDDSESSLEDKGRRGRVPRTAPPARPPLQKLAPTKLRIIAGQMRGRKIQYNGDPGIRPMKERTRESVFSLLGGYLYNTFAVDLFGGTGILAIESISRGADGGVIFELSRPAVSTIVDTLKLLKLENAIEVHNIDTLRWMRSIESNVRSWPRVPWMIYCCPPYRMWSDHKERLLTGISELFAISPPGSKLICETEHDFDMATEVPELEWDIRKYQPAFIAIASKPLAEPETPTDDETGDTSEIQEGESGL
jgi:16S rRNA (guanine966-N2)-methyltransferase